MRILVSNDGGIYSPGVQALAEAAKPFGEVRVVAPDAEQCSISHAITADRPLSYRHAPMLNEFSAYRVNGTSAGCVALSVSRWGQKVDLVLSGINLGLNLGNSIWHSGAVAAAKKAILSTNSQTGVADGNGRVAHGEGALSQVRRSLNATSRRDLSLQDFCLGAKPFIG